MYKKIAIIGIMGSGKSTLAIKLGKLLNIDVHHLDKIYFKPGWVKIPSEEGESIQRKIASKDSWIIDGNWTGSMDIRLAPADTIIFLDFPKWFSLYRTLKRALFSRGKQPPDKQEGNREKFAWGLFKAILNYPRERIYKTIENNSENTKIHILKSQREVDNFIDELQNQKK